MKGFGLDCFMYINPLESSRQVSQISKGFCSTDAPEICTTEGDNGGGGVVVAIQGSIGGGIPRSDSVLFKYGSPVRKHFTLSPLNVSLG